ncbi:acetyl-CoA carboxylase biotin carboxyl carrier protein [uncultured Nevskia sp.]|uniref:acetyl-CoA carboxylase biotin carboxyl carrier protein n=1 Tax=uncultured Nevskia sp. TaxID=228950 RepID=UPI002600205A|nr:acetyl-CoA carboxylase biotin carboxyl carrier protein [uncultured Nevskia sp.]
MALSESEILRVLDMFDRSSWSEMLLQSGSMKLLISKTGRVQSQPPTATALQPAPAAAPVPAASAAPPAAAAAVPAIDPCWIAVKAPMLGHFYAAPKPGAPPFVTLGQMVTAEDTIAILEVMKLMNHVKAGVAGKIARIAVADGDLVEFEQALIYIQPA